MNAKPSIGIDLGTTNSVVAYRDENCVVQLVKNDDGSVVTPSAVYFDRGDLQFGKPAVEAFAFEPQNVAMFFKRNMGNVNFAPEYAGKTYNSEDLSALFLTHMRKSAEAAVGALGPTIVTVPAYFHNEAREATLRAARSAGFDVLRTINEPTAAAVAYGATRNGLSGLFLVYDLGGGTFDVTLIEYAAELNRVVASDGDNQLGGFHWDGRLMNHVATRCKEDFGLDPLDNQVALGELRLECESAKKILASRSECRIAVGALGVTRHVTVTRKEFEDVTADLVDRTSALIAATLNAAGVMWPQISGVLLVGGSTRMPAVRNLILQLHGKPPLSDINPDECVAYGAAIQASVETGGLTVMSLPGTCKTSDVTPHSLGYVAIAPGGKRYINDIIIQKNKPVPLTSAQRSTLQTWQGRDNGLDIYLLQGESSRVLDNTVLGLYQVDKVPHSTGTANLEVSFGYDLSGIVQVFCRETVLGVDLAVTRVDCNPDLAWTDLAPQEAGEEDRLTAILAIDTSSSMSGTGLTEAVRGANNFLDKLIPSAYVGLATFGPSGLVRHEPTNSFADIRDSLTSLNAHGGTPLTDALTKVHACLKNTNGRRVVVVLSDGAPNDRASALSAGDAIKSNGIRIITIGAGNNVDYEFLKSLASDPSRAISTSFGNLASTFGRIARSLGVQATLDTRRFVRE